MSHSAVSKLARESEDDQRALRAVLSLLDVFRAVGPKMALQRAHTLALVWAEEGLSFQEYAERAGVEQAVMTRHLMELALRRCNHQSGSALVEQRGDPTDVPNRRAFLTPEGRALMREALQVMKTR
jgi:DNA-binding MarR family transcriptional regulator